MDELIKQKNPNWKVKVYLLNDSGNWDDCGTGTLEIARATKGGEELDFFKVTKNDENAPATPSVVPQERLDKLKGDSPNPKTILFVPILKYNQFDKQGGKILVIILKTKIQLYPGLTRT
jgi:hypothetical protein